jgi:DNA-binding winged helix-turn-helix (wHTH) protein
MANSVQSEPVIRFQDFQVNLETGELWKAGVRLKLQDQPFKVLATLLQRPGQVVTREELRQLIWPHDSSGDFDHAINLAVTKLRSTLGDSADVPHVIETLPRRGYRFIASVAPPTMSKPTSLSLSKVGLVANLMAVFSRTEVRWFAIGATRLLQDVLSHCVLPDEELVL